MVAFWKKLKLIYSILRLILSCENLSMILEVVDLLKNSKKNIILTTEKDNPEPGDIVYYSSDENLDVRFAAFCRELMRDDLKRRVGDVAYDRDLEFYEPFTAQVFMEADYQMARAEAYELELQYCKIINDPNSMPGPGLKNLWDRVEAAKKKVFDFEKMIDGQRQFQG